MIAHTFSDRLFVIMLAMCVSMMFGGLTSLKSLLLMDAPALMYQNVLRSLTAKLNRSERGAGVLQQRGTICVTIIVLACLFIGVAMQWVVAQFHFGVWVEVTALALLLPLHSVVSHIKPLLVPQADVKAAVAALQLKDSEKLDAHGQWRCGVEYMAVALCTRIVVPLLVYVLAGFGVALAAAAMVEMMFYMRILGQEHEPFARTCNRIAKFCIFLADRVTVFVVAFASMFSPSASMQRAMRVAAHDAGLLRAMPAPASVASFAGALNIGLGGPYTLMSVPYEQGWAGQGTARIEQAEVKKAFWLYRISVLVMFMLVLGLNIIF